MRHKKKLAAAAVTSIVAAVLITTTTTGPNGPPLPRPVRPAWLVPRTNTFKAAALPQFSIYPWDYGTNTGKTTNYSWDFMVSTDLQTWSVMASNVSSNDITHTIITNDGARRFFKMRGRE